MFLLNSHGYSKIPQLRFGGPGAPLCVDSDEIVNLLEPVVTVKNNWKSGREDPDTNLWRAWAREKLVRYIVINVNRSMKEAWDGYDYIDQFDSIPFLNKVFLKVAGTPVMYLVSEFWTKPKLQTLGYEGGDERNAIHAQIVQFTTHGLRQRQFHGGQVPDLADIEAYGIMQSIRGHALYTELEAANPAFKHWLADMDAEVAKRRAPPMMRKAY
jgi:microsomal prostaglandin-E synthase 2